MGYPVALPWCITKFRRPEDGMEVIGYHPLWIHPDYNPEGLRVCFHNDGKWISAVWDNEQDCYNTKYPSIVPTHWTSLPKKPVTNV